MRLSKRTLIVIIIISFLTVSNIVLLFLAFQLFPAYGGFTRQIIFIKPDATNNSNGYFIIIDELAPDSQKYDINWLLHSRGNLSTSSDKQSFIFTVPSYISNDAISMEVSFLEVIDKIKEESGYFFPESYKKDQPHEDLDAPYIKATYAGSKNPLMATVLYPKNDSDILQAFPQITKKDSGLKIIGDNDYLYYNINEGINKFTNPSINFDGKLFFLRKNNTDPTFLEYFYLQDAKQLKFEITDYFLSSYPITNILATYSNNSQISGSIKATSEQNNLISIYCPFSATMVKLDQKNTTFSQAGSKVSFSITDSSSFVISKTNNYSNPENDPLRTSVPKKVKPTNNQWEFDENLFQDLEHPYILFNQTELFDLRNKCLTKNPWKDWYNNYTSDVDGYLSVDIGEFGEQYRYIYLYELVLKFAIEDGINYLNKIKEFLLDMGSIKYYSQDLFRAYAAQVYAIAYDITYNNLTNSERSSIENYLYEHSTPLMEMELYSDNNHRVVDAGGLGTAGLTLKNSSMINKAIDTILIYYYTHNPEDGGSYEGHGYNAYAMSEMIKFAIGLKRLNGFNFFKDPLFLASLDFMSETLGPIALPPLFEDGFMSTKIQEVLLIAAAQINDTDPIRANNYQYIWEQRQNNTFYSSASKYGYINGSLPTFDRIIGYSVNNSILAFPYSFRKEIWKESSMAFLRSADTPDGLYLAFSCKNYSQSHNHYDENSFEIWAFGAYVVNNPGYPGFGKTYHDWSIGTEASNTLLIGGSGQLQEIGDGLIASISSPYFSMVIGQANKIYNDLGSFEYAPEFFLLIFLNFILIGIVCIFYIQISKTKEGNKEFDKNQQIGDKSLKDGRSLSKSALIKMAFLHPNRTHDYIYYNDPYKEDAKFLDRMIIMFIAGLMTLFYVILILDMKTTLDYHSQYYESMYDWLFEILPYLVLGIVIIGAILTFLCSFAAIKVYRRCNRLFICKALEGQRIDLTKKKINSISTISLIWQFPVLIFSFFLLYFTTANSFKTGIHRLFTELGSVTSIYQELLSILQELIRNFVIILIFSIPFLIVTLKIFSYGIYRNTDGVISKNKAWKISLISIILLLVIFFLLFSFFYIEMKLLISTLSYEGTAQL